MVNAAPLAQLRSVDPLAWGRLCSGTFAPGTDPVRQALAAALMDHTDIAREILGTGTAFMLRTDWPDMTLTGGSE